MEHQTKIARILGPEIGLNFVTGFLGGHTLSRYIAKKIIRLGFCAIPRPRHVTGLLYLVPSIGLVSCMLLHKHKP
jgi:hypothetical protein